jgi:hypothetical protein
LFGRVLEDPELMAVAVKVVGDLCQEKDVFDAVSELAIKISQNSEVSTVRTIESVSVCFDIVRYCCIED